MRAHLIQYDIQWEQPTENFALVEQLVAGTRIGPGDLVVLPEMFSTGFSLRNHVTTAAAEAACEFLQDLAIRTKAFVQGGIAVAIPDDEQAENRAPVFTPQGEQLCEYAKIHPFGFGRENEVMRAGTTPTCWDWQAGEQALRVGVAICYDLRFPELFRRLTADGAQCFCVIANWPDTRQHHWRTLAIARAIENQGFMLAINRCGSDPHLNFVGGSIAIDPKGDILGELGTEPGVLSVDLDPAAVTEWRKTFPALRDIRLTS